jgi:putative transcriptional regulator
MKKTRTYKSRLDASIHEVASALHRVGSIDAKKMREFDMSCLTKVEDFSPEEIKALREREDVTQLEFALYLNVSKTSISKWETGEKHPAGSSMKLLSLVKKNGLSAIV